MCCEVFLCQRFWWVQGLLLWARLWDNTLFPWQWLCTIRHSAQLHHASLVIIPLDCGIYPWSWSSLSGHTHVCALLQEAQQRLEAAVPAMFQPEKHAKLTFLFGIITTVHPAGSTALDSDKVDQICCTCISKLLHCSVSILHVLSGGLPSHAHICGHKLLWDWDKHGMWMQCKLQWYLTSKCIWHLNLLHKGIAHSSHLAPTWRIKHAAVPMLPARTTEISFQHVQFRQVMHVIQEDMMWTSQQSAGAVSRANREAPVIARWQNLVGVWIAQQPSACDCLQLPQPAMQTGYMQQQWLRHAVCMTTAEVSQLGFLCMTGISHY